MSRTDLRPRSGLDSATFQNEPPGQQRAQSLCRSIDYRRLHAFPLVLILPAAGQSKEGAAGRNAIYCALENNYHALMIAAGLFVNPLLTSVSQDPACLNVRF